MKNKDRQTLTNKRRRRNRMAADAGRGGLTQDVARSLVVRFPCVLDVCMFMYIYIYMYTHICVLYIYIYTHICIYKYLKHNN